MDGQAASGQAVLNPTVSVVIPLYNKKTTVARAVRSVLDGAALPMEIIVVDDGSTDGSAEALEEVQSPLLRVLRRPNGGAAAARNTGVSEARGDYIAFLDADDVWTPCFLQTALTLAKDFPNAGLYGLAYAVERGNGPEESAVPGVPPHPWRGRLDSLLKLFLSGVPFCSDTVLIPKEVFADVGGFMEGESIGEDVQMWARISLSRPVVFDTAVGAVYHQDAPNRAYVEDKPLRAAGYARWLDETAQAAPPELRPAVKALREKVELGRMASLVACGDGKKARAVRRAFPFSVFKRRARLLAALSLLPRPLYRFLRRLPRPKGPPS